jgi:hypothetical protein
MVVGQRLSPGTRGCACYRAGAGGRVSRWAITAVTHRREARVSAPSYGRPLRRTRRFFSSGVHHGSLYDTCMQGRANSWTIEPRPGHTAFVIVMYQVWLQAHRLRRHAGVGDGRPQAHHRGCYRPPLRRRRVGFRHDHYRNETQECDSSCLRQGTKEQSQHGLESRQTYMQLIK